MATAKKVTPDVERDDQADEIERDDQAEETAAETALAPGSVVKLEGNDRETDNGTVSSYGLLVGYEDGKDGDGNPVQFPLVWDMPAPRVHQPGVSAR